MTTTAGVLVAKERGERNTLGMGVKDGLFEGGPDLWYSHIFATFSYSGAYTGVPLSYD